MIEDFKKIMSNIEIKRPVPNEQKSVLGQKIQEKGILVQAFSGGNLEKEFKIFGEEMRTYAAFGSDIYEVYTPNFNIFLYKVFTFQPQEWRDKTLIAVNWNSVKRLEVHYPEKPQLDVKIEFDSAFFKLEGVQKIDTARLFGYLQIYQKVRAYEYIDRPSFKDSLEKMPIFCEISVEDILPERSRKISLYKANTLYGKLQPSGETFKLTKSFAKYLAVRTDFEKKQD